MIAFVENMPSIDAHADGFMLTIESGEEVTFLLTRHAFTALVEVGKLKLLEANAKATVAALQEEETPKVLPFKNPNSSKRRG